MERFVEFEDRADGQTERRRDRCIDGRGYRWMWIYRLMVQSRKYCT